MLRRILLGLIPAGAAGIGIFWVLTIPSVVAPASLAAYTPNLANGLTTFNAGGCSSCHAVPNQPDRLKEQPPALNVVRPLARFGV